MDNEERAQEISNLLPLLEDEQVEQALLQAVRRAQERERRRGGLRPQTRSGQGSLYAAESLEEERQKRLQTEAALKQKCGECQKVKDALALAQQKLQQAETELNSRRQDLSQAQERCKTAEAALNKSSTELEAALTVLKEKDAELEPFLPFREAVDAFKQYRALAQGLPEYLAQSLPRDNALRFLTTGCQRDTIEQLWDRFREQAEQLQAEQLETVVFLLDFFLARYNSLYDQPVYQLMRDEAGRPFDDRRHTRSTACSKYQGDVERVIFPGIWNMGQNRALRKSVVYFQQTL